MRRTSLSRSPQHRDDARPTPSTTPHCYPNVLNGCLCIGFRVAIDVRYKQQPLPVSPHASCELTSAAATYVSAFLLHWTAFLSLRRAQSNNTPATPRARKHRYRRQDTSKLCTRFVSHTCNCPKSPCSRLGALVLSPTTIPALPPALAFAELALFHSLKECFPANCGSSDCRIFLSAYMFTSKITQRRTQTAHRDWQ